jgi:ceramide glucosyltransferase
VNPLSFALVACGRIAFTLAGAGVAYTILSGLFLKRFFRSSAQTAPLGVHRDGVSLLKPLHGEEPGLGRNLQSTFDQNHGAGVQMVFGVHDAADPARRVADALIVQHPGADAVLCIDGRRHGRNGKISNLINMAPHATQPILIVSDSDIGVPADYLERLHSVLARPEVGVVTCPYYGVAETGFWSTLAAMGLSYHFLPNVIAGVTLKLAAPCMGSTIALRRETLARIGGFEAFADVLADDYAIGQAVRRAGLKSVVAPVLVSHSFSERSFAEFFSHELRWARTVKGVDLLGHIGSLVSHPLALALIAAVLLRFAPATFVMLAAALAARLWLMRVTEGVIGVKTGPWWLVPLRDMLSFLVFVSSFAGRAVEWRGVKFHVTQDGDLRPV